MESPVILFDGVCNLCNNAVNIIIRNDRKKIFRFGSLQSAAAQKMLQSQNAPPSSFNSIVLIENGFVYTHSTAALRIAKRLPGLWKLLYGFILVPPFIRNSVYRIIARNRYKWFGKKDACMIPDASVPSRFINENDYV